jgi:putative peptidoglycan lipid II flippase
MNGPAPDTASAAPARPGMLRGLLSFSGMTRVSRGLGLVRDQAITHVFGASAATDAFWVAFRLPNFMRRLFAEGSFSTAFVPVFTEVKETRPHADLKELVSRVSGTLGGVLLLVTALGLIFTPQVAWLFNLGGGVTSAKFGLTVDLLRLTFPFLLFVSLTALAGGALNSFHKFAIPALTPVILNLCMIAGALWLAPKLAVPIMGLGWAILAAGILQLLFQLPSLRRLDLLTLPRWGWRHPDVRKVVKLMVPTLFGSSIAQINLLLDTVIASLLYVGSQTWLSQADRFLELPLGVFGIALGTVILPTLSRHHVNTDHDGFSKALDWGLRTTLLIVLPAFYARQDTRTPVRAGVASLVANMVLNVAFLALLFVLWVPENQRGDILAGLANTPGLHLAIGLASALASYLNLMLLWHWLRKAGVYDHQAGWARHLSRLGLACVAMVAVLLVALHWIPDFSGLDKWHRVGFLAALVGGGALVYAGTLLALGLRPRDLRGH